MTENNYIYEVIIYSWRICLFDGFFVDAEMGSMTKLAMTKIMLLLLLLLFTMRGYACMYNTDILMYGVVYYFLCLKTNIIYNTIMYT